MSYFDAFKSDSALVDLLGESNAHFIWALGLYLEESDLEALASESLTDGPDDKKLDFVYVDRDAKRIVLAQGYFGEKGKDAAPANKASDLNTAVAWLLSGNLENVPDSLRPPIEECRSAIAGGEIDTIDLLYVHNRPESANVNKELQTVEAHFRTALKDLQVAVHSRELGQSRIDQLFASRDSHILVKEQITCPAKIHFETTGPNWKAAVLSVPGPWLHTIFTKHGEALFSANYRGFLGASRRRRINNAIRSTAESHSQDFWVFNNGITLLTLGYGSTKDGTSLTGVSIINGAQTTGSIGSVDLTKHSLSAVTVLCRVIQCSDDETIGNIVRYNNTQNEITSWDQYSNDPEQGRIEAEFASLGYSYSRKRGIQAKSEELGIDEIVQPLVAFHGRHADANRGRNEIFDRKALYNLAFEGKKARHILFVYTLARAIDERRLELKKKSSNGTIITIEEQHLALLRNLRFKYFLCAVVARVLESILGRKVDPEAVAFAPNEAATSKRGIVGLVAAWAPIVESVLAFVATQVGTPAELAKKLADTKLIEQTSSQVAALLYAGKASAQHAGFAAMVSDS